MTGAAPSARLAALGTLAQCGRGWTKLLRAWSDEGPACGRAETWRLTAVAASFLFSQFMGGLTTAMFLFLIASGLSLVFGVMRVINFAHGSFYMIGAYLAWQAVQWLQPPPKRFWPAALFAALGVALLGAIVERLLLRYLYGREELYQLLFTYALVLILGDAAKFVWGTGQLSVSTPGRARAAASSIFGDHLAALQPVHHWRSVRPLRSAAGWS